MRRIGRVVNGGSWRTTATLLALVHAEVVRVAEIRTAPKIAKQGAAEGPVAHINLLGRVDGGQSSSENRSSAA